MNSLIKRLLSLLLLFICSSVTLATDDIGRNDKTTLITVGGGKSEADAKRAAMISAVKQTFRAFISDKTDFFNKKGITEECTSPESGNIQSCEMMVTQQLMTDNWAATAKVVVSINNLLRFAKTKGLSSASRFDESEISARQLSFIQTEEEEATAQMVGLLHEPMQTAYNYNLSIGSTKSTETAPSNLAPTGEFPLIITAVANNTMDNCSGFFLKTLSVLSMSAEETRKLANAGKSIYEFTQIYQESAKTFYLKSKNSKSILTIFKSNFEFYVRSFKLFYNNTEMYEEIHLVLSKDNATFNFPHSGQTGATFNYIVKTENKTERFITGYSVKSTGVRSKFKNGGYVVYENKGHGFVASLMEVGGQMETSWKQADSLCRKLFSNGYYDWRLPSSEEQKMMYANLEKNDIAGFRTGKKRQVLQSKERVGNVHHPIRYWSSEENTVLDFETGQEEQLSDFIGACFIRAVRSF